MDNARPYASPEVRTPASPNHSQGKTLKADIHPNYQEITVTCSCGNSFKTKSVMGKPTLHVEVCSECHPFYTGTQKIVDTAGRIDKFRQKYGTKAAT
jgi:large subunit ribosomal protein L31